MLVVSLVKHDDRIITTKWADKTFSLNHAIHHVFYVHFGAGTVLESNGIAEVLAHSATNLLRYMFGHWHGSYTTRLHAEHIQLQQDIEPFESSQTLYLQRQSALDAKQDYQKVHGQERMWDLHPQPAKEGLAACILKDIFVVPVCWDMISPYVVALLNVCSFHFRTSPALWLLRFPCMSWANVRSESLDMGSNQGWLKLRVCESASRLFH